MDKPMVSMPMNPSTADDRSAHSKRYNVYVAMSGKDCGTRDDRKACSGLAPDAIKWSRVAVDCSSMISENTLASVPAKGSALDSQLQDRYRWQRQGNGRRHRLGL